MRETHSQVTSRRPAQTGMLDAMPNKFLKVTLNYSNISSLYVFFFVKEKYLFIQIAFLNVVWQHK